MKLTKIILCVILFYVQIQSTRSENILFYNVVSSYSHRIVVWPWVEALAARGHNITFLQPYRPKHPNPKVHEFYPQGLGDAWEFDDENGNKFNDSAFLAERIRLGPAAVAKTASQFPIIGLRICDRLLSNAEMAEFIKSNKFDLVVIDFLYNECAYGLAYFWGAKTILFHSTYPTGTFTTEPLNFMGTDELLIPLSSDTWSVWNISSVFFQKVVMVIMHCMYHVIKHWSYYPNLSDLLREKLGTPDMPEISELVGQTNLVLYNSHFSEEIARILPPLFIAVPAMHVWDNNPKALPKDIDTFVAKSGDEGFIYVSFGSLADINTAPLEFQNLFMRAFIQSKVRILWKRGNGRSEEMPENMHIASWMPQQDILASPKCRGFITHGGMLGIQEATMFGVPMIVMPLFGEQDVNAQRIEDTGRGVKLEASTLTEEELIHAIQEILTNKTYSDNVRRVSRQLKDQQNSPVDTAVYWSEYVLRHNKEDLASLRPQKLRNSFWFQVNYLDVWVFLGLIAVIAVYFVLKVLNAFMLWLLDRQAITTNDKRKQN